MQEKHQEEMLELTALMNDYMMKKKWTLVHALNFMVSVLTKSAVMASVKKEIFNLQCDHMKKMFLEMEKNNLEEIFNCDLKNPLIQDFLCALKKSRESS